MKRVLMISAMTLSLMGVSTHNSQATTITFDGVASGTNINTEYAASGVTFGCFNGGVGNLCTGNAFAVASIAANSSPNVISLVSSGLPFFDERNGFLKATFSSLQSSVSIDAKAVNPPEYAGSTTNKPFLAAYSSTNAFLGQAVYSLNTNLEGWETLTFTSATSNIAYVVFSSFAANLTNQHAVYGMFDNLTFSGTTPPGGGNGNVPEPASLLLLGSGLVALAARRRSLTV